MERALREGIRSALRAPLDARWGDRLASRALKLGDQTLASPPLMAWRVARALGVSQSMSARWLVACTLFYGAADLLDDADDGDLPNEQIATARAEAVELIFVLQQVIASFKPALVAQRLAALFGREGARMACGQALDLEFTGRLGPVDLLSIARGKAGAELAALFGGAAILAGRRPKRFEDFGRALGTLLQVLSDRVDALGPSSRDFRAAKPTLALRPPGATEAELYALHGGDRRREGRAARMRASVLGAPARAAFEGTTDALVDELARALGARAPRCLVEIAVAAAKAVTQARAAGPRTRGRASLPDPEAALEAARAFLRAHTDMEEATEVCRHGLFGAAEVRGDLFGRLFIDWLLEGTGVVIPGLVEGVFQRRDDDGWRYYPGRREIPPDADDTGLALQLAARVGRRGDPRVADSVIAIRANQRADGLVPTWLVRADNERADVERRWAGAVCPVATAQALLGVWRCEGEGVRGDVERGARALGAWLAEEGAPPSEFYAPVLVDALGGWAFDVLVTELGLADEGFARAARDRVTARLSARRDLGSAFGTTLETALSARALLHLGALQCPGAVLDALVDAQEADGGYGAEAFFRTVPHPRTTHHGARTITTAAALCAMTLLRDAATEAWSTPTIDASEAAVSP